MQTARCSAGEFLPSQPSCRGGANRVFRRQGRFRLSAVVAVRWHSDAAVSTQKDSRSNEAGPGQAADAQPDDEWAKLLAAAEAEESQKAKYRASVQPRPPRLGPQPPKREDGHPQPTSGNAQTPVKMTAPPEGQPLPEGLPTGFRDMSLEEQEEELWILSEEGRLGTEWELEDPGKHRYANDWPPYSPSKVIGMLQRSQNRTWTPREYRLACAIASNRSLRPSIMTAQAMLRRRALLARRKGINTEVEPYLGGTEEWKSRLGQLAAQTGITEGDLKQWAWILVAPQRGDLQLRRFLMSNCRKPLFLLWILLARDKKIEEPATLMGVLRYIKDNYILQERPQEELDNPKYQGQGRSMTWWHFVILLYRLVLHARETWPAAMPLIARLAADYITTLPTGMAGRKLTGLQARSLVFNKALRYVGWPACIRPLEHMEHNWAAQRHLLRLATSIDPPLMMDLNSYRSIRTVLIGLSKSRVEARNAERAAKTWPPYRRALDGIDERRNPEDDLSRSVKTGLLARESGYNDDIVDRALSVLGGSGPGGSPTIQTRSLRPPMYSGARASRNIFSEWAARVKATRTAREAWIMFENPPYPGLKPTTQVYAEMFKKVFAKPVTDSPMIRPGDVKEVFPEYDGNLSEFEIARLTPPRPEELYDLMRRRDNLQPAGECLVVLLENSRSRTEALRYLLHSPFANCIEALKNAGSWVNQPPKQTFSVMRQLAEMPVAVFNAWIVMLCRIHARSPRGVSIVGGLDPVADYELGTMPALEQRTRQVARGASILEAIELTTAFHSNNPGFGCHDRKPWHTIMEALAGRKMLYSPLGAAFNALKTLTWFMHVYEKTTALLGIDPISFETLCLMIRKTLKLSTFARNMDGELTLRELIVGSPHIERLLVRAHRLALKAFENLTVALPTNAEGDGVAEEEDEDDWSRRRMIRYNVSGRPLYRYMMALGCCGNEKEMVRLMDWILDGWELEHIRERAKTPTDLHYEYLIRTFAYFIEMGEKLVDPAELDRLRNRLERLVSEHGCTWFWPDEDWRAQAGAASEAEADLLLVERWRHLRNMVLCGDPARDLAKPLAELVRNMPGVFKRKDAPPELVSMAMQKAPTFKPPPTGLIDETTESHAQVSCG